MKSKIIENTNGISRAPLKKDDLQKMRDKITEDSTRAKTAPSDDPRWATWERPPAPSDDLKEVVQEWMENADPDDQQPILREYLAHRDGKKREI